MDKAKLRKLLTVIRTGAQPLESTDQLESGIKDLTGKLQKQMSAKSLEEVNKVLGDFQKKIDLSPIKKSLEELKGENGGMYTELQGNIKEFFDSFSSRLETGLKRLDSEQTVSKGNKESLNRLEGDFKGKTGVLDGVKTLSETNAVELSSLAEELRGFVKDLNKGLLEQSLAGKEVDKTVKELVDALRKLRQEMLMLIGNVGGGNANRNIAIGGNTSVLSQFTDINFKAGSGITISYTTNPTTKYTDVTIAANGSGTGITRSVNSIAISTAAGSTAAIDYVYLCAGTLTLTLPTTVGNKNLYTVKNIGSGVVTIATTGGETIDGSANVVMPVQFTSVDLISNNSGDWSIT